MRQQPLTRHLASIPHFPRQASEQHTHLSSNSFDIFMAWSRRFDSMPSRSAMTKPSAESIFVDIFSSFFRKSSISSGEKLPPSENTLQQRSAIETIHMQSSYLSCCVTRSRNHVKNNLRS